MPGEKHRKRNEAKLALLNYIDNTSDLDYDKALAILIDSQDKTRSTHIEKNENLTQMGRYINASTLTPSESGMSPGRCPV
jgi:hypothetical protein